MKRPITQEDIPNIKNGKLKLVDNWGNNVEVIDWENKIGDTENIHIICMINGLPVGFNKDGYCSNIYDGEYFNTYLYVDDGLDIRGCKRKNY